MVHHQTVTLVLKTNDFSDRRRNQEAIGNQMPLNFVDYLLLCLLIGVPTGRGLRRHTGVVVKCLVSSEKNDAPPLKSFYAGVVVERVIAVRW
jgi:hypothetical protein